VGSGVGVRREGRGFVALVTLTVIADDGGEATAFLPVDKARGIGLDLIAAAAHAGADSAIRQLAKARGLDGDSLILAFRELAQIPPDDV
jgi:hypothetical protein